MIAIKKIFDLLSFQERRKMWLLLGMILIMALLDVIGVASIMPFIAVLVNPQLVETNYFLNATYSILGFKDVQSFIFFLGTVFFGLLVFSLGFKALTTYMQLRFALMLECSLGKRLVEGYLHQPYMWFLNRHGADLGKTILSEVGMVIQHAILPLMIISSQSVVAFAIISLLLYAEPLLTIIVILVLGTIYGFIFKIMGSFLVRIGAERISANQARFTAVAEAFGAIKEIKASGLENYFSNRFYKPAEIYSRHQASAQLIAHLPRYVIEAIAFGGLLLVMLTLLSRNGNFSNALNIVALFAFAGYRLMPALQQIYASFSDFRFAGSALEAVHNDLKVISPDGCMGIDSVDRIQLTQEISLKNIHFTYPESIKPAINGMSLVIPAGSIIGLVGSTGSGKTTTIDLILGLFSAQEGWLIVDGRVIDDTNRHNWQRMVGYVPQQIYLADDTVAANIAFGIDAEKINLIEVERTAKIANLHDFVVQDLPQGYDTKVGERGVRLSGGQRQRIGIARALYRNPQVLIFDEATSALDQITEGEVMEALNNLSREITVILVAHRLNTVRKCDQIFLLEKGRLVAQGTFDELEKNNHAFKKMAGTNL